MCKLIHTKSGVLNLALETQYVTEFFEKSPPQTDEKEKRVTLLVMDAR